MTDYPDRRARMRSVPRLMSTLRDGGRNCANFAFGSASIYADTLWCWLCPTTEFVGGPAVATAVYPPSWAVIRAVQDGASIVRPELLEPVDVPLCPACLRGLLADLDKRRAVSA